MMLYEYIEKSSSAALLMQNNNGSMPSGHNGPYHDVETPVRNTSHWLITFLKAYKITGDKKYLEGARQAGSYLAGHEARPMRATFWHRKNPEKDFCNGLIGQAWTLEALAEAVEPLDDSNLYRIAEEVFLLHPFDMEAGIWRRVGVDGMYLPIDGTFNHQLWFAAVGGLLSPYSSKVRERVKRFVDRLPYLVNLYPSGLIRHKLFLNSNIFKKAKRLAGMVKIIYSKVKKQEVYKATGYHQFNLYALALLKRIFPTNDFWESKEFISLWKFARSKKYRYDLESNLYGYPYNPPGFEMAFALEVFSLNSVAEQSRWVREQFKRCFNFDNNLMVLNTVDPMTHAARIYEATRLRNLALDQDILVDDG